MWTRLYSPHLPDPGASGHCNSYRFRFHNKSPIKLIGMSFNNNDTITLTPTVADSETKRPCSTLCAMTMATKRWPPKFCPYSTSGSATWLKLVFFSISKNRCRKYLFSDTYICWQISGKITRSENNCLCCWTLNQSVGTYLPCDVNVMLH